MSVSFPGLPLPPPTGTTLGIDERYRNPPLAEPMLYSYRINAMPDYAAPGSWTLNDESGAPHVVQVGDYVHWDRESPWVTGDYDPWRASQIGVGQWVWEGTTPKYPVYYDTTERIAYYARHHISPLVVVTPFPPAYGLPGNPIELESFAPGDPNPTITILNLVDGFIRLTGPDGDPGAGGIPVWGAAVTGPTGGPFVPDLTDLVRVEDNGLEITPQPGHLIFTNNEGDIKLWQVGTNGAMTPLDLPDGPAGPPGSAASAPRHLHDIEPPVALSYGVVRDRFATFKYGVNSEAVIVP